MDKAQLVDLLKRHVPYERSVIECGCGFVEHHDGLGPVTYSYAEHLADVITQAS